MPIRQQTASWRGRLDRSSLRPSTTRSMRPLRYEEREEERRGMKRNEEESRGIKRKEAKSHVLLGTFQGEREEHWRLHVGRLVNGQEVAEHD